MADRRGNAAGSDLTGPADTVDATVMVSTTPPLLAVDTRAAGSVDGVVLVPVEPAAPRDTSGDRFEIYQVALPNGQPQWMRRNVETGATEMVAEEVAQQDRADRRERASALAVEDAKRRAGETDAAARRAAQVAQAAAAAAEAAGR